MAVKKVKKKQGDIAGKPSIMRRIRGKQIKTKSDYRKITIGGWLQGKETYLCICDEKENFLDCISKHKLYRLAKAIVRHYEYGA